MTTSPDLTASERHPLPVTTRRRWPISPVWIVPGAAAVIGLSMVVHAWLSTGPEITITFRTAEGLEPRKTPVKYKDVNIGTVREVSLSEDGSQVVATVSLVRNAHSLVNAGTRFWVVRPRIGMSGVSGVDTLLSGAYIGMDAGKSAEPRSEFAGLETPPTVISDTPGTSFVVHASDLGSLDIGSPVYYRRVKVGRVASYSLDDDGGGVSVQTFVDAPYDHLVTADTRFWNASGVDISLGADGLKLQTQSVATIIGGGVAFATPAGSQATAAPAKAVFNLARDEQTAMEPPQGPAQLIRLRFPQAQRGLSVGAPVEFSGVQIGHVTSVQIDYHRGTQLFDSIVDIEVYPRRLGPVLEKLPKIGPPERRHAEFLSIMVAHGLRAQTRSGNILTGQLYISLDILPHAPPVAFDRNAQPLTLPTVPGGFDKMQEQMAGVMDQVSRMPLESIGRHLDTSLADLDVSLKQLNGQVLPSATQTLAEARQTFGAAQGVLSVDGPLQLNIGQTLQQLQRTAHSLRTLTDLLGRHPEALLRGQPAGRADPASPPLASPDSKDR